MISRSAFNQLRHSSILLLFSMVGMAATYLLPPALVFAGHRFVPAILGGTAWLLMVLSYLPVLRLYRLSPLWALALPGQQSSMWEHVPFSLEILDRPGRRMERPHSGSKRKAANWIGWSGGNLLT